MTTAMDQRQLLWSALLQHVDTSGDVHVRLCHRFEAELVSPVSFTREK